MQIVYDPAKRLLTLQLRQLDFDDAAELFAGPHFDRVDDRRDYGEVRIVTFGMLRQNVLAVVWTQRQNCRRIISMRKAHDHERKLFHQWLERSG